MAARITTMQEFLSTYYNPNRLGLYDVAKSTGTALTTTTNYRNITYSAKIFYTMNTKANALGVMKKASWGDNSGWRVVDDWSRTLGDGGIAEDGNLSTSTKLDPYLIYATPKQIEVNFQMSKMVEEMSKHDNRFPIRATFLKHYESEILQELDKQLNVVNTTATGYQITSLDKLISSNAEVTNCGDMSAGDADVYNIDRDAAATDRYDSEVNHNSNVDRALTDEIMRATQTSIEENGGGAGTVMITGYDTAADIARLYTELNRYMPAQESKVSFGIEGINTQKGMQYGEVVASVLGVPIIRDHNVVKDGSSRIYWLNMVD